MEAIRDLYRHMSWADAVVWRAVLALPAAADDRSLREKLWHIHMVQHAFLSIWTKTKTKDDYRELATFADLEAIEAWGREYHDRALPFLAAIEEAALDEVVRLPWADRLVASTGLPAGETRFQETLLQVAMHSTYHRGQVNTRLRELGAEPPLVDYIAWIWYGRPAIPSREM